jgi:NADH-quinone oxidoreductase subunit G
VARLSASTAGSVGVPDGGTITVATTTGSITLPAAITDMVDGVVWLPTNSAGSHVRADLGVAAGSVVSVKAAG